MRIKNAKQRILAALMSVMCLTMLFPSGVMAAETPADTAAMYAVTLEQTTGGTILFSDGTDYTAEYAAGDTVSLEVATDEGYSFAGIEICYAETGEVAASDYSELTESYSITMPDADLVISAEWEGTGPVTEIEDVLEDIDLDVSTDAVLETYVMDNVDDDIVGGGAATAYAGDRRRLV